MNILDTIKKFCVKHPKLAHIGWTWNLPTFSKKNEPEKYEEGKVVVHYCWCGRCHWDPPTCCQK